MTLKEAMEQRVLANEVQLESAPGFAFRPKFLSNATQKEFAKLGKEQGSGDRAARLLIARGVHSHNLAGDWVDGIDDETIGMILDIPPVMAEMVQVISAFNNPEGIGKNGSASTK